MSEREPIRVEEIDGQKIPVYLNQNGEFFADVAQQTGRATVKAESVAELRKKLHTALRRGALRVSVPISLFKSDNYSRERSGPRVENGDLTGIHAANRNVLVKIDGKTEQLQSYGEKVLRRLSDCEARNLVDAFNAMVSSRATFDKMVEGFKVDPKKLVAEASGTQESSKS